MWPDSVYVCVTFGEPNTSRLWWWYGTLFIFSMPITWRASAFFSCAATLFYNLAISGHSCHIWKQQLSSNLTEDVQLFSKWYGYSCWCLCCVVFIKSCTLVRERSSSFWIHCKFSPCPETDGLTILTTITRDALGNVQLFQETCTSIICSTSIRQ